MEPTKLRVAISDGVDADVTGQPPRRDERNGQKAAGPSPTGWLPVLTATVLEVDGWAGDPPPVMVRLAVDSGIDISTDINRAGFELALRVTGDVWKAFESLGLVPDDLSDLDSASRWHAPATQWSSGVRRSATDGTIKTRPNRTASTRTFSIPTVSVGPASWCDIFWWLC